MTRCRSLIATCFLASCLLITGDALAFKLYPHATSTENRVSYLEQRWLGTFLDGVARWIIEHFTSPVHEEITHRIWGCEDLEAEGCLAPLPHGSHAPAAVLFGVQWNDNPPFSLTATKTKDCPKYTTIRLPNYSKCWYTLFKNASKRAELSEYFDHRSDAALLYRVHFGDMQFLHAMASWNGEKMGDTKGRILTCAELAYRTAIGEISPGMPLSDVPVPRIPRLFKGKGYSVENLFTRGVPEYRSNVGQVALGSLMHVIEDSFAKGHAARDEPTGENCLPHPHTKKAGRVLRFYSFSGQDKNKHGKADSRDAFEAHFISQTPHMVAVGRALKAMYDASEPWVGVRSFLDQCVFEVAEDDLDLPAGPGGDFEKT